jgi:3-methyl-2-oxobutanoate hydroxymethyltransferase
MTISIKQILQKKSQEKIICLTAYSYPIAKILDKNCDIILVGDSLGMAIYGHSDTTKTTLEMMINHGKAVKKACINALIVVDLPINTYEDSREQALKNAKKVIEETGCDAIKIETSRALVSTVKFLVDNNISVMGHIGLLPQRVNEIGGYRYQGRDENSAQEIFETALELEKAGAFSIVIEAVPADLATKISQNLKIPTIGIGASADCDGQVLVIDDLLGLNQEFKPKFVTHYENLSQKIDDAVKKFSFDVKSKKFPAENNLLKNKS